MLRKLVVAIGAAALVAVLAPSPAHAAEAGTVVFTAGAEVCLPPLDSNGDRTPDPNVGCPQGADPADFWAPVAPLSDCASGGQPDLCDPNDGIHYDFSTQIQGLPIGQTFCAGVAATDDPDVQFNTGLPGDECVLSSTGVVANSFGIGAYCGWSSGFGPSSGTVGNISLDAWVEWPAAAGGVLPLTLHDGQGGDVIGQGAVLTSGAQPGTCGLDPRDNDGDGDGFEPTNTFAVTGYAVVTG